MGDAHPALSCALRFLRDTLGACRTAGERLATTRELAARAGVSRGTMARAVAVLAAEGALSPRRRRGILSGANTPCPPADYSRPLHKWEQLKRRIEFDLYDGDFHTLSFLPAARQLQTRYGVDYRTLKKALEALARERVLLPYKRSLRVLRPEDRLSDNMVIYVTPQEPYRIRYRAFPEAGDLVRQLESECGRRRLLFRTFGMGDTDTLRRAIDDYRVLGGLLYQSGAYGRELFEAFAARRKPLAMYDNYNHTLPHIPQAAMMRYRLRVFQFDEVCAGEEVGRLLLGLGHRHIAFISPFHDDWVYPIRYESLRRVVTGSTPGNRVELVAVNNLREDLQRRASDVLEQRAGERGMTADSDEALVNWAGKSRSWNVNPDHLFNSILQRELQPLFRRALALPQLSAWVCVNDGIAIHALSFLRNQGIAVPGQLSVVGFDNIGEASYNNLSSYDFDVASVALKMLDHVLRPDSTLFAASARVINSPGMVISRASTAAPRH